MLKFFIAKGGDDGIDVQRECPREIPAKLCEWLHFYKRLDIPANDLEQVINGFDLQLVRMKSITMCDTKCPLPLFLAPEDAGCVLETVQQKEVIETYSDMIYAQRYSFWCLDDNYYNMRYIWAWICGALRLEEGRRYRMVALYSVKHMFTDRSRYYCKNLPHPHTNFINGTVYFMPQEGFTVQQAIDDFYAHLNELAECNELVKIGIDMIDMIAEKYKSVAPFYRKVNKRG